MIKSLAMVFTLASGWSFTDLSLDRLRWNPRERTATGIEALEAAAPQAIDAFETAARLDPTDPVLRFNAGSAHLVAGGEGAIEHLEMAAEAAPEQLRPAANYNLGNARLAAGDPAGAIEAYENALRADPGHDDAKFNLELALQQQQQQGDPSDDQSEDQEQSQQDQQDEPQQGEQPQQDQNQGEQDQQLPQFEEQPDMTAEQAAAILEAVENLEREQRRKQAREEMKKRPRKGKDW
ncbi:MAG: tetratricopeptide repeat protein [Thermoanaerobaculia bacterium]